MALLASLNAGSPLIAASLLLPSLRSATADPRLNERPPLLTFETNYHAAFESIDNERRLSLADNGTKIKNHNCTAQIPPASPIDLRITKAHSSRGYDAVRISVITYSAAPPTFVSNPLGNATSLDWDYSGKFKYRWTSQFDTGLHNLRCLNTTGEMLAAQNYTWGGHAESPAPDTACLIACQDNSDCNHFSVFYNSTTEEVQCELFEECNSCSNKESDTSFESKFIPHEQTVSLKDGWTTTSKYGDSYIHTRITQVVPGVKTPFAIDGHDFNVKIPKKDEKAKCIVWGDPCISSKFVGCSFGEYFDAYEKSVTMLNQLSEVDDSFDCFIMLGDNFYDSDGRVTVSFWKRLSLAAKSKPLIYILGNHDIWTGGEPSAGVASDPLQYSLQYLALDTVASLGDNATGGWFNYDINPDNPPPDSGTIYQSITATSSITNSISWFQFGGLGMLYFNGAYTSSDLAPYFEQACSFFESNIDKDGTILLIGHWNGQDTSQSWILPYGGQMVTPDARKLLLQTPGCSQFGKHIIYFDGHGHTNEIVRPDNGYLMGAHGVMGMNPQNFSIPVAAEYGHFLLQSGPTTIYYCKEIFSNTLPATMSMFDPSTIETGNYFEILNCLKEKSSVVECAKLLCDEWPYFGAEVEEASPDPTSPPTSGALRHSAYLSLLLLGPITTAMHDVATWMI